MPDSGSAQRKVHKTEPSKNKNLIQSIVSRGENDFSRSPYKSWKGDIARLLIADAAIRRGYKVDIEWGLVFRVFNEGNSWIFAQNTPESSVMASVATSDKHLTKT